MASEFSSNCVQVVVRVRPPLHRELHDWRPYQNTVHIDGSQTALTISENLSAHIANSGGISDGLLYATQRFTFDHVFTEASTQQEVYQAAAQPAVASALQGYNATIIAYGQTGTGKTYTMEGAHDNALHQGIVPRAIKDIFSSISADKESSSQYLVRASYLQIYNEVISDLIRTDRTNLTIRCGRLRCERMMRHAYFTSPVLIIDITFAC
jgi:chromosomal replication initiation ATPase DnaA